MTIDEAIKILDAIVLTIDPDRIVDDEDAIRLGIEALKREIKHRKLPFIGDLMLPGETEERR